MIPWIQFAAVAQLLHVGRVCVQEDMGRSTQNLSVHTVAPQPLTSALDELIFVTLAITLGRTWLKILYYQSAVALSGVPSGYPTSQMGRNAALGVLCAASLVNDTGV